MRLQSYPQTQTHYPPHKRNRNTWDESKMSHVICIYFEKYRLIPLSFLSDKPLPNASCIASAPSPSSPTHSRFLGRGLAQSVEFPQAVPCTGIPALSLSPNRLKLPLCFLSISAVMETPNSSSGLRGLGLWYSVTRHFWRASGVRLFYMPLVQWRGERMWLVFNGSLLSWKCMMTVWEGILVPESSKFWVSLCIYVLPTSHMSWSTVREHRRVMKPVFLVRLRRHSRGPDICRESQSHDLSHVQITKSFLVVEVRLRGL